MTNGDDQDLGVDTDSSTGELWVCRSPSVRDGDLLRTWRLLINGSDQGRLRRGSAVRLELEPGMYRVECCIDWVGSDPVDVEVSAGARTGLRARGRRSLLPLRMVGLRPWIDLDAMRGDQLSSRHLEARGYTIDSLADGGGQ